MSLKWQVINARNEVVVDEGWDWCMFANRQLLYFRENGKEGVFDWREKKVVLKPMFKTIHGLEDSVLVVEAERSYLIDLTGRRISKATFRHVRSFVDGLAAASEVEGGPYGFINHAGEWVIRPKFYHVTDFTEGLSVAMDDSGKEFYIDRHGDTVIKGPFDSADPFSEELAAVRLNGEDSYIDLRGAIVLNGGDEWFSGGPFCCGRAKVLSKKHFEQVFFIDKKGAMVGDRVYPRCDYFSEGLAGVWIDKKWGAINMHGDISIPCIFDALGSCSSGKLGAESGGKWGYISSNGDWLIEPKYETAGEFRSDIDLACVAE